MLCTDTLCNGVTQLPSTSKGMIIFKSDKQKYAVKVHGKCTLTEMDWFSNHVSLMWKAVQTGEIFYKDDTEDCFKDGTETGIGTQKVRTALCCLH